MSEDVTELLMEIRDELRALRVQASTSSRALLSRTEAARILGTDRHQIGRLVAAGLIRSVPHGKRDRIPREEVERISREGLPRLPNRRGRPFKQPPKSVEDEILSIKI